MLSVHFTLLKVLGWVGYRYEMYSLYTDKQGKVRQGSVACSCISSVVLSMKSNVLLMLLLLMCLAQHSSASSISPTHSGPELIFVRLKILIFGELPLSLLLLSINHFENCCLVSFLFKVIFPHLLHSINPVELLC